MDIEKALDDYLARVIQSRKEYFARSNFIHSVPSAKITKMNKWAKVITFEIYGEKEDHFSAHSFVALQDFETKFLGKVRRGQIFKAATWKAPAKHARGNVFDNIVLTPHGDVPYMS